MSPAQKPAHMATTKFYLDTRRHIQGKPCQIRLSICLHGKTSFFTTGISVMPEQWDKITCTIVRHPQKQYLNARLAKLKSDWDIAIMQLAEIGDAKKAKSPSELKEMILLHLDPESVPQKKNSFLSRFLEFAQSRNAPRTRERYIDTLKKIQSFDKNELTFEDVDKKWLMCFEKFLEQTSPSANARAIHLRNIRAVFNDALDDDITMCYPFRKFKIRTQPTRKRSLTVEQVRTLLDYSCEDYQTIYRDMFMLMFYLIGINAADLFRAKKSDVANGRLEYKRAKTGKLYSVNIEPEAREIISKYPGKGGYLLDVLDSYSNYKDFLHRMNIGLQQIGETERVGRGGKKVRNSAFPGISSYWTRHTWATLAASLDIPKETISEALGHSIGSPVTSIYIKFDNRKVDEANRKVIDFVNGK